MISVTNPQAKEMAVTARQYSMTVYRASLAIFDGEIPPGALLADNGTPLRDDDGNFLIEDN